MILLTTAADLQPNNILLGIEEESILADFEMAERTDPSPRKIVDSRIIHTSRDLPFTKNQGRPIVCDFGETRFGDKDYVDIIQPYLYRAPEIVLQVRWGYKVDIWSVGVMVRSSSSSSSDRLGLALLILIYRLDTGLGPLPKQTLVRRQGP